MESISLYERLWATAERCPDAVAVRDADGVWTWQELLQRAAAYRDLLKDSSAPAATAVPILVDRSAETIAAVLGTLMSGQAFSPLSPDQPLERLRACVSALGCGAIVLTPGARQRDGAHDQLGVACVAPDPGATGTPVRPPEPAEDALLYVLFTSGSTGTPKGVMVTFANIENTMLWSRDYLDWRSDDVIGNVAPFFFDISMFDLFSTFYFGVPTAIVSNTSDVHGTLNEIAEHRITSIFSAPVFFSQFLHTGLLSDERLGSVRRIVSGGDFFPPAHILAWLKARPDTAVWNVWGPTETSIVNTMHEVGEGDLPLLEAGKCPPVGRAHPRMPFVLMNDDEVVEEPRQTGEICMLGPCVTRGYLADAERTREAYFDYEGQRGFRTKDIGFVDENDNLHMVGRIGSMVKIAGYRVDLGEVESAAARVPDVVLAGAFVQEIQAGLSQLCLAVEPRQGTLLDVFSVKRHLRELLPAYMVPKRVFVLEQLPRSPNGKINRRALPDVLVETTAR